MQVDPKLLITMRLLRPDSIGKREHRRLLTPEEEEAFNELNINLRKHNSQWVIDLWCLNYRHGLPGNFKALRQRAKELHPDSWRPHFGELRIEWLKRCLDWEPNEAGEDNPALLMRFAGHMPQKTADGEKTEQWLSPASWERRNGNVKAAVRRYRERKHRVW